MGKAIPAIVAQAIIAVALFLSSCGEPSPIDRLSAEAGYEVTGCEVRYEVFKGSDEQRMKVYACDYGFRGAVIANGIAFVLKDEAR